MLTKPNFKLYGTYAGEVLRVRYNKGRMFIKAKILSFEEVDKKGQRYSFVTEWAPVATMGAGKTSGTYGVWFAPSKGDTALIVFEQGMIHVPYCIGFLPHVGEIPPEFYNDDYLDKELEGSGDAKDRERPVEKYDKVNDAWIAKIAQQLYILLHGKTGHLVIDAPDTGDNDPKIELGENADMRVVMENLAEDFYKHIHPGTGKPSNLSVDSWEEYVSKLTYTRENPRPADEAGSSEKKEKHPVSEDSDASSKVSKAIKDFSDSVCKALTTASDFVNDPVGTVVDGISDAVDDYAGIMPKADLDSVKNTAVDGINKMAEDVGEKATSGILDWISKTLSPLIGQDAGDAISNTVQSTADAAPDAGVGMASKFANKGYDTLKGWADEAGVTDAIDNVASDALGSALDAGISQVKNVMNMAIGNAVGSVVDSVLGVKSGLDTAKAICEGNLAGTIKGLFGMALDELNASTGGLLSPVMDGIKGIAGGLIGGAFSNDAKSGQAQVEDGRS